MNTYQSFSISVGPPLTELFLSPLLRFRLNLDTVTKNGNRIALSMNYSGTSDKGPSEIGTTSLQRTLAAASC